MTDRDHVEVQASDFYWAIKIHVPDAASKTVHAEQCDFTPDGVRIKATRRIPGVDAKLGETIFWPWHRVLRIDRLHMSRLESEAGTVPDEHDDRAAGRP